MHYGRLAVAMLALACVGCAAVAPPRVWRNNAGPELEFAGTQEGFGRTVITINGQPVIDGKLSLWSGAGELAGTHEGKPVRAVCENPRGSAVRTMCVVSYNGREAATLSFRQK